MQLDHNPPTADTGFEASYTAQSKPTSGGPTPQPDTSPVSEMPNKAFESGYASQARPPQNFNTNAMSSGMELSRPPDRFMPTPYDYKPSFFERMGYGDHPIAIKAALLDLNKKQMEIHTGWRNAQVQAEEAQDRHTKLASEMEDRGFALMPNARAHIGSMVMGSPERKQMEAAYSEMLHRHSPSVGSIWDTYTSNPSAHFAANYAISQSPRLQQLFEVNPEGIYKDPTYVAEGKATGRAVLEGVLGTLTNDQKQKIAAGNVSQAEFTNWYKAAAVGATGAPPLPSERMQFGTEHLGSEDGEQWMAGKGIKTDKMAAMREAKRASMSAVDVRKDDDIESIDAQLADPSKLSLQEYNSLQHRKEIYLGTRIKDGMSTSKVNHTVADDYLMSDPRNQGRFNTTTELNHAIADGTARPGDLDMLNDALERKAAANPTQSAAVARAQPVNAAKEYIYDRQSIRDGTNKRFFGRISDEDLKTSHDKVQVSPEQHKIMVTLDQTKANAVRVLDTATRLYQGVGASGSLGQLVKDVAAGLPGVKSFVPELSAYKTGLEAMATTYARSIGMEVGVLTDTDVKRWTALMPSGSDTKEIADFKIKKFKAVLNYVSEVNGHMLAGDLPMGSPTDPYVDKGHRAKVEGMIGEAENSISKLRTKMKGAPSAGAGIEAIPGVSPQEKPKMSAAQRLSDAMHAQDKKK